MGFREKALTALLWYMVLAWSTWVGGTLYQMAVIVPIWSAAPPDSVREFFLGTEYTTTIRNFFGPQFMLLRVVPAIIALGLAWHLKAHRLALGVAVACLVATVVYTLVYIYPINAALILQGGGDHSAAEIAAMAESWIFADRLRFAVGIVAFIAILHAFRLPLPAR